MEICVVESDVRVLPRAHASALQINFNNNIDVLRHIDTIDNVCVHIHVFKLRYFCACCSVLEPARVEVERSDSSSAQLRLRIICLDFFLVFVTKVFE